jgi:hypothetical protein
MMSKNSISGRLEMSTVDLKTGDVDAGVNSGQVDVEPVVGPGPELQVTALVVKGEPGDVNLARRLEDPCS